MFRILAVEACLVVLVGGCTSADTLASTSTSSIATTTTTIPASSSVGETTTTTSGVPSKTVAVLPLPPAVVVEPLDATPALGDGPRWVRSPYEFDRRRLYWLGAHGHEFVLLSWRWPSFDLAIQRSTNGRNWSEPVEVTGLPPDAGPDMWNWGAGISASSIGLIGLFETTPDIDDGFAGRGVYTSPDGVAWVEEDLPEIESDSGVGGPFAVAAGNDGFAVWAAADERRPRSDILFVRRSHGDWQAVDLPVRGSSSENWVVGADSDFLARVATDPEAEEGTHYVYRVSTAGAVSVEAIPTDQPPVEWNDDLVGHNPYSSVPKPTLYAGPDASIWHRLPTPDFSTDDEERFWGLDALTAGQPGITVAGCACGEYWGFLGEAVVTIEVPKNGYQVTVHGDQVTVDGVWDHPIRVDTRSWFDPATGTLTVPDPATDQPMVKVSCDEMRASALEKMHEPELLTPPPQDLLYSPDGSTWFHLQVNDLFGVGSYVHQAATAGDAIALVVDPTGEPPTPDPPGCPLGIYPETRPFEIWAATPNR